MKSEIAAGLVLLSAAVLALVIANSPARSIYHDVLHAYVLGLSVQHWVNDLLMAVFFLLVGLEIKREVIEGQLSNWSRRILPGVGAAGGMAVPALVYLIINYGQPVAMRGWAIPTATDIAFALGILAMLGSRAPLSLKVFLTALAILDDLAAIVVIAIFYTAGLQIAWLAASSALLAAAFIVGRLAPGRLAPLLIIGALLWFAVLKSGVHATLAGVMLAMAIPLHSRVRDGARISLLRKLEHALHPWVAFAILPLFGFANAGVTISGFTTELFLNPVTLGIAAGLFIGKQVGVFSFVWITVRLGFGRRPEGANWLQVYGVSMLCGVGFTMSLFIGMLAFPQSAELQDLVKIGVLTGSFLSALAGALLIAIAGGRPTKTS